MEASHEGTSMNASFHSSGNVNDLPFQNDSDIENNDLEDNEDNYDQLFGASYDEVDFYGFSDEEEIGCPDECPDDNAQPACKKKKITGEHPDGWNLNKWKHGNHPLRSLPQFTVTSGINFDIPEDASELYFFKLLFTDELLEYLTDETNRYAHDFFQVNKDKLRSSSDFKKWPENGISSGKMRAFLVLTFYFSIMKKDLLKS